MTPGGAFLELFGRLPDLVRQAVDGLTPEQLVERPGPGANPIGWLMWHVARLYDYQFSELTGQAQLWEDGSWPARFGGIDPGPFNLGYGHTDEQVAGVRPESREALLEYFDVVWARVTPYLEQLTADELDRVIDRNWDPPVTLGVRLVSVASDGLQHAGQAAYARGLLGFPPTAEG